jgi:hypothetical protein
MLLNSSVHASRAAFDAYAHNDAMQCNEGTCITLLHEVMTWAAAPAMQSKSASQDLHPYLVYSLDGMAGTGKLTIACTVARRCADT